MNEEFSGILNKINVQKIAYSKWINELSTELSKNSSYDKEIYLIKKFWIDKYVQRIFNETHNVYELINLYKQFEFIDNIDLFTLKNINQLPKLFILNDKCWSTFVKDESIEKPLKIKGHFYNKMIIIEFIKDYNYKIYCVFFLDKKRQIRQGYLQIDELEIEKEAINYFFDLIKIYNKSLTDDRMVFHQNNCHYLIFEYKDKILKNNNTKNNFNNLNYNNSIKESNIFIKNKGIINCPETQNFSNINISEEKYDLLYIKNINNKYNLENKKYFHKKLKIDNNNNIIKKEMPEIIENFNNKKREVIYIKAQNLNPKKKIIKNKNRRNTSAQLTKKKIGLKAYQRNNENLDLEDFIPNKTIHKVSTPGLIGLLNIGATCYMNATLQCFSNINRLRINLLNKEIYKDLEINKNSNKKLSFALAEVLSNLWEKLEHGFYSPEYFKQTISEMNPLFKGIAANDPKDLVLFLLETMHKELNNPLNNENNAQSVNNHNFFEVYNDFLNYYNRKNKSIISDEFYGFTNNGTICNYCKAEIYNIQTNNILFFPLEEVRKFKNYKHNNVSILDCFDYFEKYDIYPSFYCNDCKQNCQAYSQTKLVHIPKTLIINLNRGKGIEFNVNIIFEEYLNIKRYIIDNNSPYYYELIGVICHYGTNDMGGHFIAYCKNSNNCEWYKYNDQMVTKCSFKDVTESGLPYVLFYSYIKI